MAINTLITLKDALTAFADGHKQLQGRIIFEADDHRSAKITEESEFPVLFVAPISVQIGRAMNTHTLRCYVYERLNDDREDVLENANDTSLILRDIRVWWNDYGIDDIEIKEDISGEFGSDKELDNLVGYFSDIRFEMPSHGRCDVPVNVTPNPTLSCADSTYSITDDSLNVLYSGSIPSGGNLDQVITDSTAVLKTTSNVTLSTTSINAQATANIVAPDNTLQVNTITRGSFVAGSTVDVQLSDSGGTVVPLSVTVTGNVAAVVLPLVKSLFWELNYNGTDDVIFIPATVNNVGTLTSGSGTNVGTIEVSTDGVSYSALTFPFTPVAATTYYFKRSTATVSGAYTMTGTYA